MKSTDRYGLCQWGPEDNILREDLNANSDIVDTILGALDDELEEKQGLSEEFSLVPAAPGSFNVSALTLPQTWEKWEYLTAVYRFDDVETPFTFKLTLHTQEGACLRYILSSKSFAMVFCPRHDPDREVSGILLGENTRLFHCGVTYRQLTSICVERFTGSAGKPAHFLVGTP